MALLIIILFSITVLRTPVDIFPEINIPVVSVIWNYTGLAPSEMADRIVANSERGFTVTVNDVEHQESQSLNGIAVIKVFFRPSVNISMAVTQVTAICQTVLRGLPPGTTVVHKVGFISGYLNDSALVLSGPRGPYVLSICTRNSSSGWALLASISHAVWNFEATR